MSRTKKWDGAAFEMRIVVDSEMGALFQRLAPLPARQRTREGAYLLRFAADHMAGVAVPRADRTSAPQAAERATSAQGQEVQLPPAAEKPALAQLAGME